MPDPRNVEMAKHLSFFVPSDHVLTTQEWVDRTLNESEALRIERDAARAEVERLREAGVRVPMYRFGLSRQSATEMLDRELDALGHDASTGTGGDRGN